MSHSANYTDTGPTTAFYQGRDAERERIIKLLEPLSKCDPDFCGKNGEYHFPEDCDSFTYQYVIDLIKGERK